MKLPRNAKIFRGQLDVAPFASVSFLLVIFLLLHSRLVFTPGVRVDLPEVSAASPGTPDLTAVVAVDRNGLIYYDGQTIALPELRQRLRRVVQKSREPMTLELQVDKAAAWGAWAALLSLPREVGMREALLVTRTRTEPILKKGPK